MYCQKCGREIKQDQKFCSNCGEAILINQVPEKKSALTGKEMVIAAGICLFLVVFAVIKLMGKSDEERITGTWVLVEEMYGGREENDKIGAQLILEKEGMVYDDKDVLRTQFSADTIVSWNIVDPDKNILILINNWGEQFMAEYTFEGEGLKILDGQDTYTIWKKQ